MAVPFLCNSGSEHFLRFADCLDIGWVANIINTQTGQVVGKVRGSITFWNSLSYKSRIWPESIQLHVSSVTGEGAGTTINAPLGCVVGVVPVQADCQPNGTGKWAGQKGFLLATAGKTYTGELGFESVTAATVKFEFEVFMTFENPNTSPGSLVIGPTTDVRCDSKNYFKPTTGGCAYPSWTLNVLYLSTNDSTVSQAAKFILAAQNAIPNHRGQIGSLAMTRLTDRTKMKANRRVACRNVHPGPGQSCDEYPFASSHQGAALVPRGYWRARALNARQNSKVGTLLGRLFLTSRIIDGDPFYVGIKTP